MDVQVTRKDISRQQVADWKESGTPYLKVTAALIEQIWAGTLDGAVPATADLAEEHGCPEGDVVAAKILLAQLGFLRTDRRGFHLPEDVTWATAPEDVTYASAAEDVGWAAGAGDVTWTAVPGLPGGAGEGGGQ